MKFIITESQYRTLLFEQRKPKEIEGCSVFTNMNDREFCKAVENEISENLSEYSSLMENLLKKYFSSNEKISEIQMEQLNNESDIVTDGFDMIDEVVDLISVNCPIAEDVTGKLKNNWLSKYNIYFKDGQGQYHLLNRLDTNYTAMAVLITFFYEELLEQVPTARTVPQILIDGQLIGGFTELRAHLNG